MSAKTTLISWAVVLILQFFSIQQLFTTTVSSESLQCAPGEERHFEYESATKVWEAAKEQLHLRGNLKIRCMDASDNSTLKYLVEVLSLEPSYDGAISKGAMRAEPVLEEVGEAISATANRVKRSVSGWFSKTWGSVKDFFLTIFNPSERKSVSRDQVLTQDGIDIAAQCKAPGKGGKVPIDDSVFDDLEPKYYIGASLDNSGGPLYEFDNRNDNDDDDEDKFSFFDDPKPREARGRSKRAATISGLGSGAGTGAAFQDALLKVPFVFVQSRSGKILEVQFSQQDKDVSVRNFKRHLCDLFATNLDKDRSHLNEVTPLGQHSTRYMLNSSFAKQSEQLVRAMAVVGMQPATIASNESALAADSANASSLDDTGLSVLRTINHTNGINSRTMMPDIDRMQVRVKQVQQINDGRMTSTMGQLGMSLIQSGDTDNSDFRAGKQRFSRSVDRLEPALDGLPSSKPVEEMVDLLKVSTSFTLQMVPQAKLRPSINRRRVRRSVSKGDQTFDSSSISKLGNLTNAEKLITKPVDLSKAMKDMKLLESRLQFSPSSLASEADRDEGKAQRLEVLQDQIQMRINEELVQNKLRLSYLKSAASRQAGSGFAPADNVAKPPKGGVLGLSLTQIILDNGVTAKRKGSIYPTIEEVIELEMSLGEDTEQGSVSRLLRDTVNVNNVRAHCRSAIASLDEIRSQSNRLQLRLPFAIEPDRDNLSTNLDVVDGQKLLHNVAYSLPSKRNRRRLEHCKQVMQLLLGVSQRQAADLVIDLIDESNDRLLSSFKDEELGYGPISRYYRNLRQQFVGLLNHLNRPSETILDKLMARLPYLSSSTKLNSTSINRWKSKDDDPSKPKPEFVYIAPKKDVHEKQYPDLERKQQSKYNRSLLKEVYDSNSDDGAGSLVMSITSLASKSSISQRKRIEIIEKLFAPIKQTSCNLFEKPDLDILESMANFNEPMDELTGKLVHLARRCKHHDQYLVACVHGLQGQLRHQVTQRFFIEQLRSNNVSCLVKSEIVLSLIDAILIEDLQQAYSTQRPNLPIARNDIPSAELQSISQSGNSWPSSGLNQLDDVLLELSGIKKSTNSLNGVRKQQNVQDRKCLNQLVAYYMSKKRPISNEISSALGRLNPTNPNRPHSGSGNNKRARSSRSRRAVRNDNNFWDEAYCKRWSINQPSVLVGNSGDSNSSLADLANELDDNIILQALANKNISNLELSSRSSSPVHRADRLVEKEDEVSLKFDGDNLVRRRHKCSASKSYGPKNAQAILKAEVVNDLVGPRDENKFLARFRLATNFLGKRIDVGRMYLWHQKRATRAHLNILGRSLWDTSHNCQDKAPSHLLYVPLFDFNLWLVKVSVGMRLQSEMGFFSNCRPGESSPSQLEDLDRQATTNDQLELYPTITARASGEATAKFVVARMGLSLASNYGYQGNIRVSRQPESCISILSSHQPMNITLSSWFQLWDSDCHYWGSRRRAEPQATRWRLDARQKTTWLDDECLQASSGSASSSLQPTDRSLGNSTLSSGQSASSLVTL